MSSKFGFRPGREYALLVFHLQEETYLIEAKNLDMDLHKERIRINDRCLYDLARAEGIKIMDKSLEGLISIIHIGEVYC